MIEWPPTLPSEFERSGYDEQLPERLLRSVLPGRGKVRRHGRRSAHAPIRGAILMARGQWVSLRNFYQGPLARGSLKFLFPLGSGGASKKIEVAFTSPPTMRPIGGEEYLVFVELERLT